MIAIYPGTFDPITNGHIEIARRSAKLFDHIIVAIATSNRKQPLFSLERRVELAQLALAEFPNVSVEGFTGLLAEFAQTKGAKVLIRGVRAVADFEYEYQLASVNQTLYPDLESVLLTPTSPVAHISSTIVRDVAAHKGDVSHFVPDVVADALKARFAKK